MSVVNTLASILTGISVEVSGRSKADSTTGATLVRLKMDLH